MPTLYRFPRTNVDDYKGTISFTALEEKDISQKILGEKANKRNNLVSQGVDPRLAEAVSATTSLNDLARFAGKAASQRTVFGSSRFLGDTSTRETTVLYLPTTLQFTDGIEYTNVDLGAAGEFAARAIRGGASLPGVASAMIESMDISSVIDAVQGEISGEKASLAALRTIGKISEGARGALETEAGIALNPNRRSSMRGVALRTFQFTFNMIPYNQAEAREMHNIIKWFRLNMYPEDIAVKGVTVGYRFPKKFQIQMRYNGRSVATGILPCFLANFSTNYNPNSMSFHKDGEFPEISMSMTFTEERTLRRADIEGGF